ncbi:MAG TPA: hypothetical protein VN761_10615 [Candidatus Polarisedimenticolia bacterium]|nr:hypothetical protein [Candidatus Polarisedimenticolia bacterium]
MKHKARYLTCAAQLLFILTANASAPSITYPPRSQSVVLYQQAGFGVIANGSSPMACQWYKNGAAICNATNDYIVFPHAQFSDEGAYSVTLSNSDGFVSSSNVSLEVASPHAGDMDGSFLLGTGISGSINSILAQPDGKILVAGALTNPRGGIARLNPDGSTDYTFMNGAASTDDAVIDSMALQSDGKIIVAGSFTKINGTSETSIARLNPDGSVDNSFQCLVTQAPPQGPVYCVAVQNDGKILVGGLFNRVDGIACSNIVRLNNNGSLDTNFHAQTDGFVSSMALQRDGKALVAAFHIDTNGISRRRLVRFNTDGSPDTGFADSLGGLILGGVSAIAVQSTGQILVGGTFANTNGAGNTNLLLRLNKDGTLDTSFNTEFAAPAPAGLVNAIVLQSDGKILIGGIFTNVNNSPHFGMARLHADGTPDESFTGPPVVPGGQVNSIALETTGQIIITPTLGSLINNRLPIAKLNADGTLDGTFQSDYAAALKVGSSCMAMQSDGKILVGGAGNYPLNSQVLARLDTNGMLDDTFAPTFSVFDENPTFVSAIAIRQDQKIIISGHFQEVDGIPCTNMARLEPDGSLDTSFHPPDIVFDYGGTPEPPGFDAMALQSDGKIVIGGNLTTINGVTVTNIARLNPDGSLDTTFTPPSFPYGTIDGMATLSDGKLLVAGLFNVGPGDGIVRLLPDGELDESFQTIISWMGIPSVRVAALATQPDGKILIGGLFDIVDGVTRRGIARLNTDGTIDTSFQSVLGYGSLADSIEMQTNGQLIIGEYNATAGATPPYQLIRLNSDGTADTTFQTAGSVTVFGFPNSIQTQSDGKLLFLGNYTSPNAAGGPLVRVFESDFPPMLKNLCMTPTQANLTWRAISNHYYRVQYVSDLSSTNWTDVPGDIYATGATASKSDPTSTGAQRRFYRVRELP